MRTAPARLLGRNPGDLRYTPTMGVIPRQRDRRFLVWDEADKRGLKPSDWGSADPTGLEERTVQSSSKWDDAGAGAEEGRSDTDRGLYQLDWRMPERISFGDFTEAAYKHACVVANHIYEKGGDARVPFVWLSYVLKNTADRYIRHILHSQPDFEEGEGRNFWEEYYLSTDRAKRHKNGVKGQKRLLFLPTPLKSCLFFQIKVNEFQLSI